MVLATHDALPDLSRWQRTDMFLDGVVPFIRGTLEAGGERQAGWFLLDTGAYTSILKHERLSSLYKFSGELRRLFGSLGGTVREPVVSFGGHTFSGINYAVNRYDGNPSDLGLLGNDVLKRVNRWSTIAVAQPICGRTGGRVIPSAIRNGSSSAR